MEFVGLVVSREGYKKGEWCQVFGIKSSRKQFTIHHIIIIKQAPSHLESPLQTASSYKIVSLDKPTTIPTRVFCNPHFRISNMPSYTSSTANTSLEKDTMSTRSVSTMTSTKSHLRSILPSKRSKPAAKSKTTKTPADKTEEKLLKAEALHAW